MASLKIDMPVPSHIVRNVSDMHTQLVATLGRALKRNGIVKVARVDRVDRDDKAVRADRGGQVVSAADTSSESPSASSSAASG